MQIIWKGFQSNHEIFKSTKSFKRLKSTFDQNMRMNNNTNTSSYVVEVELWDLVEVCEHSDDVAAAKNKDKEYEQGGNLKITWLSKSGQSKDWNIRSLRFEAEFRRPPNGWTLAEIWFWKHIPAKKNKKTWYPRLCLYKYDQWFVVLGPGRPSAGRA